MKARNMKTKKAPKKTARKISIAAHRVENMAAQGDVLFRRVDKLPTNAKLDEKKGPIVVAHSETGHHHSIDDVSGAKLYRLDDNPLVCYLQLSADTMVIHRRDYDTHAPLNLVGPGVFEVRRQVEYRPGGSVMVQD